MIEPKYGLLIIIEEPFKENKIWKVKCRCQCGTERIFKLSYLKCGDTKSCGCYNKKKTIERNINNRKYSKEMFEHPLYNKWDRLKKRYKLELCEEWLDYNNFYKWGIEIGYQDKLYLYRLDNKLQYSPSNCYFGKCKSNNNPEKYKNTCLEKYGIDNLAKLDRIKEHNKKISHITKEKIKATNLNRYGVEHVSQNKEIRQKQIKTLIKKYGCIAPGSNGKTQKDILHWINSCSNDSFKNNQYFDNKEIDIYSEKLKLGIEYCGLYWHNEMSPEPRLADYHKAKLDIAKKFGFRLITIFSDEWLKRRKQVENFLISIIKPANNKFYARKCEIMETDQSIAKQFVEDNHIQGYSNLTKISFGLYYNNELLGVICGGLHHRNQKDFILNRLCFKYDTQIIGGASKLFNKLIDWCKQHNYNKIISWSDNRWSEGNIYKILNFKLDKELSPDYSYVKIKGAKERISKQSCQKKAIGCPPEITEKEFMLSNGCARIWDCGKKRWIFNISPSAIETNNQQKLSLIY